MSEINQPQSTILVVEDEPVELLLLQRILETRGGFAVIGAPTTDEALTILARQLPDLMMVSHWIGDKPGIEFSGSVRNLPDSAKLPIILLSASNRETTQQQAAEAGVNAVLWYPY